MKTSCIIFFILCEGTYATFDEAHICIMIVFALDFLSSFYKRVVSEEI